MTEIKFDDGAIEVDAAVQVLVRHGKITSRHERGKGEDTGRARLTFFMDNRRFHIIVNESGQIIRRSAIDFGSRALPASLRKAGG